MPQPPTIEAIETRLWSSADNLRANSNFASNEYFLPVMGLIFLRHAFSRFLTAKDEIEKTLPTRGGEKRPLTKEDFAGRGAIYLQPEAQFDYLASLPDDKDRGRAVVHAMELIEKDYTNLKGQLPKVEYQKLDNDVMGQLLRTFNDPILKKVGGDVFGRIYEYFLTKFADLKAHDNGEFFTPVSIVQMIVNVIEPDHGSVLDPACGSGGMFVQSAHFVEQQHEDPTAKTTFFGLEKNPTTIRLGKMNLAVHGLEGDIKQAISYYEDPHNLVGKADFVMANPPFNVDEIDAEKVKNDPRLPFGLPGVNKKGKVSNGNYVWISYFHSYLNERGRAGFVMSSQASSAGRGEAEVRRKLIETGDVDIMMAIRSNFFYTRTVPCELWFLNRSKPKSQPRLVGEHRDKVLMIDARNTYRKVTRKVYDFSPEQQQNLLAIVWLYRGQTGRFLGMLSDYLTRTVKEAGACLESGDEKPLADFADAIASLRNQVKPFLKTLKKDDPHTETLAELEEKQAQLSTDLKQFAADVAEADQRSEKADHTNTALNKLTDDLEPLSDSCRVLIKETDHLYKLAARLVEICETEADAKASKKWVSRDITNARKAADEARKLAVEQLRQVRYFWRQAHWLTSRFPDAELRDVEGLVKLVDRAELEANDWSLTPGRYVGVAPEAEDEDFDFAEAMQEIHAELNDLNAEAVQLAETIQANFEELVV